MKSDVTNLVWMDLEMTGLNPINDVIIEIATIITNSNLDILAEGPVITVHQPDEALDNMDEWNTMQHGKSGLTKRVRNSSVTNDEAEQLTLNFIKQYVPENTSPLCGNSISQDRRFLFRYMPELESYLHYRHLDVSTLKILAQLWKPAVMNGLIKDPQHRALQDIRDSIEELRYYREHFIDG